MGGEYEPARPEGAAVQSLGRRESGRRLGEDEGSALFRAGGLGDFLEPLAEHFLGEIVLAGLVG